MPRMHLKHKEDVVMHEAPRVVKPEDATGNERGADRTRPMDLVVSEPKYTQMEKTSVAAGPQS